MKNMDNYPPDYNPRIDSGEEEDEDLFDENGNYVGPEPDEEPIDESN